ncbi:MAG: sulfoxide reductase heme-binding subunit YedZ [Gemmatimonadaceae bacterium]|nr:sulfoxide reductase heme-binding subunit YedZ [Gemmatimonadaceae bacterium]
MVRRWIRPALWVLVIAPLVWMIARGIMGDLGANPIERLEDETGRWTLRLLAGSLAVSPLVAFTRWGWLVRERRFLGLGAFFYAVMHLNVYIGLDNFFDVDDIVKDVLKHLYVTVGMTAFLLLVPLAVTSTKGWVRRLGGKRWTQLHRLVYVAATAGCVHFIWAVKKDKTEPLIYAAVFLVLFALRFVERRPTGRSRREAGPVA